MLFISTFYLLLNKLPDVCTVQDPLCKMKMIRIDKYCDINQ